MLKPNQRPMFFTAVRAAWMEHIAQHGLADNLEQMDAWYRDEMAKVCHAEGLGELEGEGRVDSIKKLDHVAGFDAVMLHFAIIAQDDRQIAWFSSAVERRFRHIIKGFLKELSALEMRQVDWAYAAQILAPAGQLPPSLENCPVDMLRVVVQALSTHRRRIMASRGQLETRKPGLGARRWEREYHYRAAR